MSTEGSYQQNSGKWSPRIAGLASTRFAGGDMGFLVSGAYARSENELDQYRRAPGQSDYTYRGSTWAGNEVPARAGFSAPAGTTFGSIITNPDAIAFQTGSDPVAYAKLYPGTPYNTPGRLDDSLVRIPTLASIEQQDVKNERIGVTASYQWQIGNRTQLSVDGAYSRFKNDSTYYQVSTVGLNRNNTNATYNTATNTTTPVNARALYPGLCAPAAGSDIAAAQDCGQQLYGTTPAFATALDANGNRVTSVLGSAAVVPGGVTPANANIFSTNPFNLDPYDYYNNPGSIGFIPSSNRLAFRGQLIGRPAVDVLDANVTNGLADYLALRNVDFRSAADHSDYVTEFKQASFNLTHEFSDRFRTSIIAGMSESSNQSRGLLVEYNRLDSPGTFIYDERDGGAMPKIDLGFNAADPGNWETVKGYSAIRHFERSVRNTYKQGKIDFDWQINDEVNLGFGGNYREYTFKTSLFERLNDLLNPTLKEAGATTAQTGRVVQFGQGLTVPDGTLTSFYAPDIDKFDQLFDFTCNCVNKWGDWRLTNRRNGGRENFAVTEQDTGLYFQLDWNSYLFGRPFRGNAGTRVSITDVTSNGTTQAGRPIVGRNRYTDYLPSMNLVYEPVDDVIVRLAASRVMARPLLGNLSPTITAISVPSDGSVVGASLTVGNPQLAPFRSTNLDASFEWYFTRGGLLSVALFRKGVESFPQTIFYTATLSQFADAETVAAIRAQFTNAAQLAYLDAGYPFTARQFRDAPGGYLRGVEVSAQADFTFLPGPLRNLGFQANYTYIQSELNYILDPGAVNAQGVQTSPQVLGTAPFLGVSPQAFNATLYYETSRLRARVSVAQRKGFAATYPIATGSCAPGIVVNPTTGAVTVCDGPLINDFVYTRATTNVDASISYKFTDWLSVTAEGLNLTNQTSQQYAYQGQEPVTRYASSGPIYRIGARARF